MDFQYPMNVVIISKDEFEKLVKENDRGENKRLQNVKDDLTVMLKTDFDRINKTETWNRM